MFLQCIVFFLLSLYAKAPVSSSKRLYNEWISLCELYLYPLVFTKSVIHLMMNHELKKPGSSEPGKRDCLFDLLFVSLAASYQHDRRADDQQSADHIEDCGTHAACAGKFGALVINYFSCLFKVLLRIDAFFNREC